MNIVEAKVPQVARDGDTFTIPPVLVCKRYYELALTVLYDLLELDADVDDVLDLRDRMALPPVAGVPWTPDRIRSFVCRRGRVIVDEWFGPVTHRSHVEPVE